MGYVEYFNLLNSGYKALPFALSGVIFLAIGIVGIFLIIRFRNTDFIVRRHPRILLIFMSFLTVFAIFWTSTAFATTFKEYITLRNALINNEYKVVEGKVIDFHPMPYQGHEEETFTVQGVKFAYSDFLVTNAFNNTKSHGGPIDAGKYVRIYYFDGKILRLWVKQ